MLLGLLPEISATFSSHSFFPIPPFAFLHSAILSPVLFFPSAPRLVLSHFLLLKHWGKQASMRTYKNPEYPHMCSIYLHFDFSHSCSQSTGEYLVPIQSLQVLTYLHIHMWVYLRTVYVCVSLRTLYFSWRTPKELKWGLILDSLPLILGSESARSANYSLRKGIWEN